MKKGFLIGGRVEGDGEGVGVGDTEEGKEENEGDEYEDGEVRCFCIEWAGM